MGKLCSTDDGLEMLDRLVQWRAVEITVIKPEHIPAVERLSVIARLEEMVDGRFMVFHDREDESNEEACYFIARFESEVDATLASLMFEKTVLRPSYVPSNSLVPEEPPEWLLNFARNHIENK